MCNIHLTFGDIIESKAFRFIYSPPINYRLPLSFPCTLGSLSIFHREFYAYWSTEFPDFMSPLLQRPPHTFYAAMNQYLWSLISFTGRLWNFSTSNDSQLFKTPRNLNWISSLFFLSVFLGGSNFCCLFLFCRRTIYCVEKKNYWFLIWR